MSDYNSIHNVKWELFLMVFPFELLSCMQMGVLKSLQLLDIESIH